MPAGSESAALIRRICATAASIPTEAPEEDGTLAWDSTTIVLVEVEAGDATGLGYTYASGGTLAVIDEALAPLLLGRDALDIAARWQAMLRAVRNIGRQGVAACAISALDVALWDLKAKLLDLPLARLLGRRRERAPIYGSGGFTNSAGLALVRQLRRFEEEEGCGWVKMKIGARVAEDGPRMDDAIAGLRTAKLMVDANGALSAGEAVTMSIECARRGVVWFEEPVSSDDLAGLRRVRDAAPAPVAVSAGEYGYDPWYFQAMLGAEAVDVLQADATRCLGFTGFLKAAALAEAANVPLSTHCAPALHLPAALAAPGLMHMEWFYDHVRIEQRLFDEAPKPADGALRSNERPGLGLAVRADELERMGQRRRSLSWEA